MKVFSRSLFYIVTVGGLIVLTWFIINAGKTLEVAPLSNLDQSPNLQGPSFFAVLLKALHHPLAVFIFQLIVILIAVRLCGALFKKMGQPAVVGEMIAGIVLGPSVLGTLLPGFSAFVFPKESLSNLQLISQIGLILFMFVIGMELDLGLLKKKVGAAVLISHASIVFPYGLGVLLSYFLYQEMAPPHVKFYAFALFMGIAMSITAFPVLARVIRERGLTGTKLGVLVITCAAADDITAWCILAFVVAVAKATSVINAVYVLGLTLGYVLMMLAVVKPILTRLAGRWLQNQKLKQAGVAVVFITLLFSAYIGEVIGIHALFGALWRGLSCQTNGAFGD